MIGVGWQKVIHKIRSCLSGRWAHKQPQTGLERGEQGCDKFFPSLEDRINGHRKCPNVFTLWSMVLDHR